MLASFLFSGISFLRNCIGIIRKPYETYRSIVAYSKPTELFFIGVLLCVYFALASVVKTAAFRPYLLTKQFIVLFGWAGVGFIVATASIWIIGKHFGGKGEFYRLTIAWGYTMIPTVTWFFATSLLFVLLPPPRTTNATGILFSLVYLVFSATLFWWKFTLSYLVLRFGLKLDLVRIVKVAMVCVPVFGIWSYFAYRMGVFKVPFL